MNLNPLKILYKRISFTSAVLLPVLIAYLAITFVIFYRAVIPSYEDGSTSWTFAVDSTIYTDYADSLRAGRNDPLVLGALAYFPNTLWAPVLIALALNSALLVMLLNYALFVISVWILKRGFSISAAALVVLLLLNPTTTTSLLCVNKEVLDLFSISIFLYSQRKHNSWLLLIALFPFMLGVGVDFYLIARIILQNTTLSLILAVLLTGFFATAWYLLPRLGTLRRMTGSRN